MEWQRYDYRISTEPSRLQRELIHELLRQHYWSKDVSSALVDKAIAGSLCFGLYRDDAQLGFARVVTDKATFAYLAEVWLDPELEEPALGEWLIATVLSHPDLQGLQRVLLSDPQVHELYRRHGFNAPAHPEHWLEIFNPELCREAPHILH
ncbi:GNAT family N-acetyltransferase [Pseudaeromonas sp. ZJS20]|uniref:GNAT family N-acetyltransferase n=1 Tax=Pseudaeromonas aegiceratis TaxID=3153928 RepID=UPI00390CB636